MRICLFFITLFLCAVAAAMTSKEMQNATTINLVWTYFDKKLEQRQYIFPEPYIRPLVQNNPELYEKINVFNRIKNWVLLNPDSTFNIWYDKEYINQKALQNTVEELDKLGIKNKVNLINIRDILKEYNYFSVFFENNLPKYYRADIFRLLATYFSLKQCKDKECLFAYFDFSIDPIRLSTLINYRQTYDKISKYNYIFGETDLAEYENSFHIMKNDKDLLLALEYFLKNNINYIKFISDKAKIPEQHVWLEYTVFTNLYNILKGHELVYDEGPNYDYNIIEPSPKAKVFSPEQIRKIITEGKAEVLNKYLQRPSDSLIQDQKSGFVNNSYMPTRMGISKISKFSNGKY